ncbi:MAG: glucosaminidase domain-containing protein [Eubacteriaceae bacterium]|nr:glucosaminidase domain-containing protein [Eubacteriaceae bacterium]
MKKTVISLTLLLLIALCSTASAANESGLHAIMGTGSLSASQMQSYLTRYNRADGLNPVSSEYALSFAEAVIEEAQAEGVNWDVAFALMMHETGYLNYGGDVDPAQNNFGGLGAVGNGEKGASFPSMQLGIRAVIQHLKCYASTEPLNRELCDPRWSEGLRGKAEYAEHLGYGDNPNNTGWAYPGDGYGIGLIAMVSDIGQYSVAAATPENPAAKSENFVQKLLKINAQNLVNFAIAAIMAIALIGVLSFKPKQL